MGTGTFGLLLLRQGEAKLLAAPVVLLAWVEAHLVGSSGLNMSVKDHNIRQALHTIPDHLITIMMIYFIFKVLFAQELIQ